MSARNEFISRLQDMPTEYADRAIKAYDFIEHNYEITKKETALSTQVEQLQYEVALYRDCKAVEGNSKEGIKNRVLLINSLLCYAGKPVKEITANDVRAFLYNYQEQRGTKDTTLNNYRHYLSSFFNWCLDEEIIDKSPMRNIKPIKCEQTRRESLSQVELEQIRNACETDRDHLIVEMLYSTGCRVSELAGMKTADINLTDNTAVVHGKGKKVRTVFINAKALFFLTKWKAEHEQTEYLITNKYGEKASTRAIQYAVAEIVKRSGLQKKISPHSFRHTTASVALANGMPIESIQQMLGHSSCATTLIYADVTTDKVHAEHTRCVI